MPAISIPTVLAGTVPAGDPSRLDAGGITKRFGGDTTKAERKRRYSLGWREA